MLLLILKCIFVHVIMSNLEMECILELGWVGEFIIWKSDYFSSSTPSMEILFQMMVMDFKDTMLYK